MHTTHFTWRRLGAALVVAAGFATARAADDFVTEDEPTPPPVQPHAVAPRLPGVVIGGQLQQGGRVIVMPGLQVQFQPGLNGEVVAEAMPPRAGDHAGPERVEPYLGVVAGPLLPQVRAQLELPEGVGLSIDALAAGGPAEKAGLKRFDVIHKFNDQVVCSADQLTTLVRVVGAGTKVSLAILRGGRERTVEAVIEERTVPAVAGAAPGMAGVLNLGQMIAPAFDGAGFGPDVPAAIDKQLADALARVQAAGGAGFAPGMPGAVRAQVLAIGPNAQSATVVSDARGTVEIRSVGGRKMVTVKDPAGMQIHAGSLDTDEDLERVPEDYRDWVREVGAGQPAARPAAPEAE